MFTRVMLAAACASLLATCGGGGGGDSGGSGSAPANTVAITGNFTGGTNNASLFQRLLARIFPAAYALDVSQVTRVILISINGSMTAANVTGGRFTISATTGAPVGVIFVGASNNFLGYMSLGNGIDTLPLGKVAPGTTTIDLQTLSSTGRTVTSLRNPIGQELPLTADEQAALKHANALFSVVIRSPDVDGNRVVDVLEGKHFSLTFFYNVRAGVFGANLVPTVEPVTFRSYTLQVYVRDTDPPATAVITGPPGSGLLNAPLFRNAMLDIGATYLLTDPFTATPIPVAGVYTVSYKSQTLTFNVPDQSAVTSDIVLPVPTVTLNNDGTVQRVNWSYRLGSGGSALDPLALMKKVEISFSVDDRPGGLFGNGCTSSGNLAPATTQFVPQCQTPMPWSQMARIDFSYRDLYENDVIVGWPKQPGI